MLADERYALGLETIYEGYLVHYGRPRMFRLATTTSRCSATISTRTASSASRSWAKWRSALADLIARCAHLRAEKSPGDGEAWAATAASPETAMGTSSPSLRTPGSSARFRDRCSR